MAHDESSGAEECRDVHQPEGRYANHLAVGHNAFEFVLDFGQFYPDGGRAQVHTRIIVTPSYAKAFVETLRESIAQYEGTFGPLAAVCPRLRDQGCGEDR